MKIGSILAISIVIIIAGYFSFNRPEINLLRDYRVKSSLAELIIKSVVLDYRNGTCAVKASSDQKNYFYIF